MKLFSTSLIFVLIFLTGCSPDIRETDLIGKWHSIETPDPMNRVNIQSNLKLIFLKQGSCGVMHSRGDIKEKFKKQTCTWDTDKDIVTVKFHSSNNELLAQSSYEYSDKILICNTDTEENNVPAIFAFTEAPFTNLVRE